MDDDSTTIPFADQRNRFLEQLRRWPALPPWAVTLLQTPSLPLSEEPGALSIDCFIVTDSNLAFLDQQIALAPRGPEWSATLASRRRNLSPHVGQRLGRILLSRREGPEILTLTAYVMPETGEILRVEA